MKENTPHTGVAPISPETSKAKMGAWFASAVIGVFALSYVAAKLGLTEPRASPQASVAPEPVTAAVVAPQPVAAPAEKSAAQMMLELNKMGQAVIFALPQMEDTTDGPSTGSWMLGFWLSVKGQWSDVAPPKDETSVGKVKKDSRSERGRRMCAPGQVIQIKRESVGGVDFFTGNLATDAGNILNFVAVRSTGEIVEQSRARFCGVVAGNYFFENVAGGQTQSVQMVGMFDLPENRAAIQGDAP